MKFTIKHITYDEKEYDEIMATIKHYAICREENNLFQKVHWYLERIVCANKGLKKPIL